MGIFFFIIILGVVSVFSKFKLQIDDGEAIIDDFNNAVKIISDEIDEHFNNYNQCYHDRVPFLIGALESELYDNETITEEQKRIFKKIQLLLNSICKKVISIGTSLLRIENDYTYELFIEVTNDDITLSLKVQYDNILSLLETNMFNMDKYGKYYFRTYQEVVIKSAGDKLKLGDVVKLNIELTPCE